jgi:hypothetical protein
MAQLSPAVWGMSDDAHTGNHSLYLTNIGIFGIVATGTMTNGRILADLNTELANSHTVPDSSEWNTPIITRPDSLVGWYKGKPSVDDFPTAKALLHTGYASLPQKDSSTWIGVAYIELSGSEVNVWTRFSVPFDYFNNDTPEFILSTFTSGNGLSAIADSEAWFDDVKLIYNGTPVDEISASDFHVYSSNGVLSVFLDDSKRGNSQLRVMDLAGRTILTREIENGRNHQFQMNVKDGVYIVTVQTSTNILSKKVWIR